MRGYRIVVLAALLAIASAGCGDNDNGNTTMGENRRR